MRILVLNGPNLGTLGRREPEIYGSMSLAEIVEAARAHALERGSLLEGFQSNHEGALIDRLEQLDYDAAICNFGALSHTSYALHDALVACERPAVEVHISDITAASRGAGSPSLRRRPGTRSSVTVGRAISKPSTGCSRSVRPTREGGFATRATNGDRQHSPSPRLALRATAGDGDPSDNFPAPIVAHATTSPGPISGCDCYGPAMDHANHVALIRDGVGGAGPRWLELGAGNGAFTLALVDVLGDEAKVVAMDRDAGALRKLEQATTSRFPSSEVRTIVADFTQPLPVDPASFDGVLMANSLHFVRDKLPVLHAAIDTLRPGGRFLIVEYGSDGGNPWVPWPIGYASWANLATKVGLRDTRQIGEVPSRFLGSIYAAVSNRDG